MPDITTTQIFSDGEKGITATKMNNIIANSVIQPDFVTAKPASSTLDPTDQLLEVKGAGTYARITGSQLISSVSAQVDATPQIYSVRLRSFNAVGNPNFSIAQNNPAIGTTIANVPSNSRMVDRWFWFRAGTHQISAQQVTEFVNCPSTSFMLTDRPLVLTLSTAQATLAAGDYGFLNHSMEGVQLRELFNDVHSVSILIKSTKAGHKFSYFITDPTGSRSYTKLCTIPTAGVWTLITIPNIAVFPPAGTWALGPGVLGLSEGLSFGLGTSQTSASDGVWVTGTFYGSPGADNWFNNTVSTTQVELAFIQHEPGAVCTTPMDKPFIQSYDECLRYYCKSYDYGMTVGGAVLNGCVETTAIAGQHIYAHVPFKRTMAKTPAVTVYAGPGGAVNSVYDAVAATNRAISGGGARDIGVSGFGGVNIATQNASPTIYQFHYTADTGW
jgi:hypothetical protein